MSWRPSRRLSTRAMWGLWLLCLVLTPVALVGQHLVAEQIDFISSIRLSTLVAFLWLMLAWLWPERSQRNGGVALSLLLVVVVHYATGFLLGEGLLSSARVGAA